MNKRNLFLKQIILICMMLFCSSATLFAQLAVKGTVVDEAGEPIIGANVLEVGTTNGTITDFDGNFALNVKNGAQLTISYIGYVSQTIKAASTLKVTLTEDSEALDEVVVVGYGVTQRRNFTGSVATVKVGEGAVSNMASTNALDMLRGMTTGLTISQSGEAGATTSIQVRGQKSISGDSDPLIVLDGVIYMGTINDIDPNTVESMSVLKDATTLAAYGSQAANGVIMITTKKGVKGKPVISFKTDISMVEQNFKPDLRDGYQYIELYNNRNGRENKDDISWLGPVEKAQYDKGEWTDWIDYVSRKGLQQNYSAQVSGATDNMDYFVGLGYTDNKNFIKGNQFKRESVTGRLNTKINKYINFGINFNLSESQNDGARPNYTQTRITPWGSPTLSDGVTMRKYIDGKEGDPINPLWNVYNGYDLTDHTANASVGATFEVRVPWIEGLSYKLNANYNHRTRNYEQFIHETNFVNLSLGEAAYTTEEFDKHLSEANGLIRHYLYNSYVIDNILTYTHEFGDHFISGTLVYTRDSNKYKGTGMTGSDFSGLGDTSLGVMRLGDAGTQNVLAPEYTLHTDVGFLGRLNYSYANKYHLNLSFRRDGSSVFGSEHKWGNFPAVGAAWTITEENFMKKYNWMDNLKLKFSWGKNGNQSLSPYGTLSQMNMGKSGGYTYTFGNNVVYGQALNTLGNPMLGWETTSSFNFGFEGEFFKHRVQWSVDAYVSKTTDQIFSRTIPVMGSGITTQSATMGQVNNWGIESTLTHTNIHKKNFTWTTTWNFTINRNKLVELYGDGQDDITNELFLNKSLGAIYGYKWIGVVQSTDTDYITANSATPGDAKYADLDGDGTITPNDRKILGYNKESFRLSMANTLTYKEWSLYFMFNGVFSGGGYGLAANNLAYLSYENMQYTNALNHPYWTAENPTDKYPRSAYADDRFTALDSYSFVRLQDLQLSYTFKPQILKALGVSSLQLYASGKNLFFIAPNWKFSDPEVRNPRSQQLARTYTIGLNLKF
ncbi:MAG: TonB-dependent receptor [Bacteroidaceae bacterium]|nr:TonB-dependent receptor [Bacteroidaceae bacterium]